MNFNFGFFFRSLSKSNTVTASEVFKFSACVLRFVSVYELTHAAWVMLREGSMIFKFHPELPRKTTRAVLNHFDQFSISLLYDFGNASSMRKDLARIIPFFDELSQNISILIHPSRFYMNKHVYIICEFFLIK